MMHNRPSRPQTAPHKWTAPTYGKKREYAQIFPSLPILNNKLTNIIQQKTGSILYYNRAINYTRLHVLTELAQIQATPTSYKQNEMIMLMYYCGTYPFSIIHFYPSDMILHVDIDAAYLITPSTKSRIAGYYWLSSDPSKMHIPSDAPFHILCRFFKKLVESAGKAKTTVVFFNAQEIIFIRRLHIALGHPQPSIPLTADSSTASDFVNKNMRMKRSKLWDIWFHWLRNA